ncbi:hypothetical protein BDY24DRAFT_435561, partial [Mrakia frigida]|uniref:uncharacterized protein n=1 Tax=Mrakia frigida TaxID=29902 RepID=UPI003FCC0B82
MGHLPPSPLSPGYLSKRPKLSYDSSSEPAFSSLPPRPSPFDLLYGSLSSFANGSVEGNRGATVVLDCSLVRLVSATSPAVQASSSSSTPGAATLLLRPLQRMASRASKFLLNKLELKLNLLQPALPSSPPLTFPTSTSLLPSSLQTLFSTLPLSHQTTSVSLNRSSSQ